MLAIVATAGVKTGNWLFNIHKAPEGKDRIDEFLGLAQRTWPAKDLTLSVEPKNLTINAGEPIRFRITLSNPIDQTLMLNGWLTPEPSIFQSNQFPVKLNISKDGLAATYHGNAVVLPPHTNNDFFRLGPKQSKTIQLEVSKGWEMSASGLYTIEIWYETYLTGRYIGVNAWTGTTNRAVVQVQVNSPEGMKH